MKEHNMNPEGPVDIKPREQLVMTHIHKPNLKLVYYFNSVNSCINCVKWIFFYICEALEAYDASKLSTEVRFISLLPCPADQLSSTLKSVHWYCSDPIFPEQPLRQSRAPPPSKFRAAVV